MADVQLEITIGNPSDAAWNGTDPVPSLMAVMKAVYGKETAAGTAGTPSTAVGTVQGITGGVPVPTAEAPRAAAAADTATGSAAAATLTYAAVASLKHCISGIYWSYNGTPTGGNLKIDDVSGTTVFSVDITAAGPGFLPFPAAIKAAAVNTAMIVTLASGGAGVTGRVNARHWTEA